VIYRVEKDEVAVYVVRVSATNLATTGARTIAAMAGGALTRTTPAGNCAGVRTVPSTDNGIYATLP